MSEHCGSLTDEGAGVCIPGECGCSTETQDGQLIQLNVNQSSTLQTAKEETVWKKIRSGVMFGIACVASPCCTPIIVPIAIALLAGTPIAAWLSTYIGWVYGGLTLLSIVSLVLGFRWLGQKSKAKSKTSAQSINTIRASEET